MSYYPGFDETPTTDVPVAATEHFDYRAQKTVDAELKRLSWWGKFFLNWRGQVSIGKRQPDGFRLPVKFFLYHCDFCGLVLTYPRGFEEMIDCVGCILKQLRG